MPNFYCFFLRCTLRNAYTPSYIPIGEVILLTQQIKEVRYFTHLVVPIESEIRETADKRFNKIIRVKCLACAKESIPVSDTLMKEVKHGGYTSGRIVPIDNMKDFQDELLKEQVVKEIYEKFQPFL